MSRATYWLVVAGAFAALAAWPAFIAGRADQAAAVAAAPTLAPVTPDYLYRDRTIAFYERAIRRDPLDQWSPRTLAGQYLQRYRERGDVEDVLRAERAARLSLAAQPLGNVPAAVVLSAALTELHDFRGALLPVKTVLPYGPHDTSLLAREAGLYLELGDYDRARALIERADDMPRPDASVAVVASRYDELTGHLARARRELVRPMEELDSIFDAPAENRAWFHFRAAQLAFEAGDAAGAERDYRVALQLFPNYWHANAGLAQLYAAEHRWNESLDAAQRAANVIPFPDILGYVADAERALGRAADAKRTDDLIVAIERIGNAQHISDRLLAVYYSEHRMRPGDALAIAERERSVRDDIFAEDTIAWAAAMDGKWDLARRAMKAAIRYDTEISLVQYHAGMIALHFGQREEAERRLQRALDLNPDFHPFYADRARETLATLRSGSGSD